MKNFLFSLAGWLLTLVFSHSLFSQEFTLGWVNAHTPTTNNGYIQPGDMTFDSEGNLLSVGRFSSPSDFDPSPFNEYILNPGINSQQGFFTKNSSIDGGLQLCFNLTGTGSSSFDGITIAEDGSIYLVGSFSVEIDFDPGFENHYLQSLGNNDIFILKLDQNANLIWAKSLGGTGGDNPTDVKIDNFGNVLVSGFHMSTVDFNPGGEGGVLTSIGFNSGFLLKLTSDGDFIWVKSFTGSGRNRLLAFTIDEWNNIYAVGYFAYTTDFDPGENEYILTSNYEDEAFIVKLNEQGEFVWVKSIGGINDSRAYSIDINEQNEIIVGGTASVGADLNPGDDELMITEGAYFNAFLLKLDSDGEFIWGKQFFSSHFSETLNVSYGNDGLIYSSGAFKSSLSLNPGSTEGLLPNPLNRMCTFLAVFDNEGGYHSSASLCAGGSAFMHPYSMLVGNQSEAYLFGYFYNTADFDPSDGVYNIHASGPGTYLVRLNSSPTSVLGHNVMEYQLFPNPTTGKLTLNFEYQDRAISVLIYDLTGRMVHHEAKLFSGSQFTIPGESGMYLIQLMDSQVVLGSMRVVKM